MAGNISNCLPAWENITSDPYILDIVKGLKIPFIRIPYQVCEPFSIPFSETETEIIDAQIQEFLSKGILSVTETEQNEYISNIFVRPKRNGKYRMILNLRAFNEFVEYERFKMDSIHTCVALMKEGCYMASLDLRDAYFSVAISREYSTLHSFGKKQNINSILCQTDCHVRVGSLLDYLNRYSQSFGKVVMCLVDF